MAAVELLNCYNKGCGKSFDPQTNKDDSCKYHKGGPIFHDALKGWSCCKKRSTDFTEFLNIPGCTLGKHSNEKPVVEAKSNTENEIVEEVVPQKIVKPELQERPSPKEPMKQLPATVGASLKQALEKQMQDMNINSTDDKSGPDEVAVGTACKNSACKMTYQSAASNKETCQYHSGSPIFHEGMKYWSCCQRKTSDFNSFLSQEGCETGHHLWVKKETGEKKVACRFDWHQTGSHVTISIFSKVALPDKTSVEANRVAAKVNIVFDSGNSQFEKCFNLFGLINPEKSSVKLLGTKVEINLKKGEPMSWKQLELS